MLVVNLWKDPSHINSYISNTLLSSIEASLSKWEKTLLYLNKRWEYSSIICQSCQHLLKCNYCDVSMSVHKFPPSCVCHLCSFSQDIPTTCSKCSGTSLQHIGTGTQQIEQSLNDYFQAKNIDARIVRFDTDSMKTKKSKLEALTSVETSDIIIGTKMVTTGFNFDKIATIGIILIEQELQIAQYNSEESVYTNLQQIIGRWGRKGQKTETIIQSFIPDNPVISHIIHSNYKDFFVGTLSERKMFSFPPFCDIWILEYRHTSKQKASDFLEKLFQKLCLLNEDNTYSIQFNNKQATKKYNQYYYTIVLKWPDLRTFLHQIQLDIIRNSWLSIIFP